MVDPTEEDIRTVIELTGTDRSTAQRFLKVKNNNVEQAVNALFEDEDINVAETAVTWDDSAWSADREGNGYGPQAQVSYSDSRLAPLGTSTAPTRGSSPVPSLRQPATKAEEDEEFEKAMANSRQDLRFAGQESGIITAGNRQQSHFGPSTQTNYDPNQWAMVPTAASNVLEAREIIPDVEATARKSSGLQPRFIKHNATGDYFPNLLTIAHTIPLAREMLLMADHTQSAYGQDPDWWRGQDMPTTRIVSIDSGEVSETIDVKYGRLIAEMQRLVAFLDMSDRSYAGSESLSRLAEQIIGRRGDTQLDITLGAWELAAESVAAASEHKIPDYTRLFRSKIGSTADLGSSDLWSIPLQLPERPPSGELTLADAMDNTLWDVDADDENFADNWMERCGEILPLRVVEDDSSQDKLRLVIPTSLYVDKYLKEHLDIARPIRKDMARLKKRQATIETLQDSLAHVEHPGNKSENLDALPLLKATAEYFSGATRTAVLAENEARGIDLPPDSLKLPASEQAAHDTMAQRLDALWHSITDKIATLEEEKQKTKEALRQLSQSNPPGMEPESLKHHYTLRGVATKPNVTYVLRPRYKETSTVPVSAPASDAMDTSAAAPLPPPPPPDYSWKPAAPEIDTSPNEDDPDAPPGWTWWRIQLDATQIHKTESSTDEVLHAVQLEHNAALLVYASDRAVNHRPSCLGLPEPLRRFVADDNALFADELDGPVVTRDEWAGYAAGRRGSGGSTMVNFDGEQEVDEVVPAYEFADPWAASAGDQKPKFLPKDEGYEEGYRDDSPEAHEIRLEEVYNGDAEMMGEACSGMSLGGVGSGAREGQGGRAPSISMLDVDDEKVKGG